MAGEVVSLVKELVAKLGELKAILATNKETLQPLAISQVVVLAGGQVEEGVVLMWEVARGEDRQAGAEAEAGVAVEEDRGAGGRSSAIGS